MVISPDTTTFCLLSFEGPDRYAQAGGLGVRITHLAETLAEQGYEAHLFFVGDPFAPGVEPRGRLTLHRWCQWISAFHPAGVYAGEEDKLNDFNDSLPPFLVDRIIEPAVSRGRFVVVLAEEWHTAETVIRLQQQLQMRGLDGRSVLFWNANNTMSFHRVDWPRLNRACQLTTVSRYMKYLMWDLGVNPLVIPNGIPAELLQAVGTDHVADLRNVVDPNGDAIMLFKVGRFDPAKRWLMAVEAAALLKSRGYRVVFPLRGGIEAHGAEVLARAGDLGLSVVDVDGEPESVPAMLDLIRSVPQADVYNIRFFLSQELMRPFYAAADAVLANSGHEPFGLVGLETMAAGGIVLTGSTGEEYALYGQGAVPLDTDVPEEIVGQVLNVVSDSRWAAMLRATARRRADAFTWDKIVEILLDKVEFALTKKGVLAVSRARGRADRDVETRRKPRPERVAIELLPAHREAAAVSL